jgi:hypothetical protein
MNAQKWLEYKLLRHMELSATGWEVSERWIRSRAVAVGCYVGVEYSPSPLGQSRSILGISG